MTKSSQLISETRSLIYLKTKLFNRVCYYSIMSNNTHFFLSLTDQEIELVNKKSFEIFKKTPSTNAQDFENDIPGFVLIKSDFYKKIYKHKALFNTDQDKFFGILITNENDCVSARIDHCKKWEITLTIGSNHYFPEYNSLESALEYIQREIEFFRNC